MSEFPAVGEILDTPKAFPELVLFLSRRRSVTAALMEAPGPDRIALDHILQIASRVPDHRKVVPFRFIVFEGAARVAFGDVLLTAARLRPDEECAQLPDDTIRGLLCRAPVAVAVIASPKLDHKTPQQEQLYTAGIAAYNLILACAGMGYAAQWLTNWLAYDDTVNSALDLSEHESIVGFVHIGTSSIAPKERARPDPAVIIKRWQAKL